MRPGLGIWWEKSWGCCDVHKEVNCITQGTPYLYWAWTNRHGTWQTNLVEYTNMFMEIGWLDIGDGMKNCHDTSIICWLYLGQWVTWHKTTTCWAWWVGYTILVDITSWLDKTCMHYTRDTQSCGLVQCHGRMMDNRSNYLAWVHTRWDVDLRKPTWNI